MVMALKMSKGAGEAGFFAPISIETTVNRSTSRPIVTMMIVNGGRPIMRRNTMRSKITPISAVIATPMSSAGKKPSRHENMATETTNVPTSKNSPCAKLMTSLALKIMVNPSAISA